MSLQQFFCLCLWLGVRNIVCLLSPSLPRGWIMVRYNSLSCCSRRGRKKEREGERGSQRGDIIYIKGRVYLLWTNCAGGSVLAGWDPWREGGGLRSTREHCYLSLYQKQLLLGSDKWRERGRDKRSSEDRDRETVWERAREREKDILQARE